MADTVVPMQSEDERKADEVLRRRPQGQEPGFDALVEDAVGLNIRGGRTLWDIFVRPAKVFAAARDFHWFFRYTPSLRLYVGLIALVLLLRFFWESEDSAVFQMLLQGVKDQLDQMGFVPPDGMDIDQIALDGTRLYFERFAITYPFLLLGLHLIAASCMRIWGKGTRFATRLRLYFIPLCAMGFVSLILVSLGPALLRYVNIMVWMWASVAVSALVYAGLVFRGLAASHAGVMARVWRVVLFTVVAVFVDFLGSAFAAPVGFWVEAGLSNPAAGWAMATSGLADMWAEIWSWLAGLFG